MCCKPLRVYPATNMTGYTHLDRLCTFIYLLFHLIHESDGFWLRQRCCPSWIWPTVRILFSDFVVFEPKSITATLRSGCVVYKAVMQYCTLSPVDFWSPTVILILSSCMIFPVRTGFPGLSEGRWLPDLGLRRGMRTRMYGGVWGHNCHHLEKMCLS